MTLSLLQDNVLSLDFVFVEDIRTDCRMYIEGTGNRKERIKGVEQSKESQLFI